MAGSRASHHQQQDQTWLATEGNDDPSTTTPHGHDHPDRTPTTADTATTPRSPDTRDTTSQAIPHGYGRHRLPDASGPADTSAGADGAPGDDGVLDEFDHSYFSEVERIRLRRWRKVCAQRPPLTREQIETVGALLRAMDQRRAENTRSTTRKK